MARKKRKASSKGKAKGRPAILSLAKARGKRGAKSRVGRGKVSSMRKAASKSQVRGRRY